MRIQHNIPAMAAYRNYTNNTSAVAKNLEKLSSGYKINRAGDDAAGLAVSEKMRAQITGLEAAQKNAKDGISLVQTAEGALTEVHDMLNRMYELAELASNGTYDDEVDRANYQKEIESLTTEIDRIAESVNFNGIKLLDGSLAAKGGATKIEIGGNTTSTKFDAVAGKVTSTTALTDTGAVSAGDKLSFTVSLSDNTSYTVDLIVQMDESDAAGKKGFLVDANGNKLGTIADTTTKVTKDEFANAVLAGFNANKTLTDNFSISTASQKFTFENREKGLTDVPQVTSFEWKTDIGGTVTHKTDGITANTAAADAGRDIDSADITEYTGKNYDDAVFTINGKKFVLLAKNMDASTDEWFRATQGVGSDVTILVGGQDGLNSAVDADNFKQNIAKIAEVTGLRVSATDANKGIVSTDGIRLMAGDKATGGLVLQIGDTAESFNKMRVSIDDMHAKAMGIGSISVATQDGASSAMAKIKEAINYVSSTRGTLGATQNRLDHTINNLSVMQQNIQDAESTIRDVDIAQEMMAYTKNNILVQSAQAMLAQANQLPQGVLQLLQ